MPVTLINVFTVHRGKEEEFVKWWHDIRADITKRPGFIGGKFYRSLKPDSKYNFINVAIWENEELYWKAFEQSVTHEKLKQLTAEMTPALYNVTVEY